MWGDANVYIHMRDSTVEGRPILNRISGKQNVSIWTESNGS
jgi:hypothetical protein